MSDIAEAVAQLRSAANYERAKAKGAFAVMAEIHNGVAAKWDAIADAVEGNDRALREALEKIEKKAGSYVYDDAPNSGAEQIMNMARQALATGERRGG